MKVTVKGFLTLREVMGGRASQELEIGDLTLLEFLHELAERFGKPLSESVFDETGRSLNRHVRVLLNGRHYSHIPEKLATRLREGDEIGLFPPMAGG